ncbi:hypothetical protein B0I37DRAFT_48518 [Chaetomium sp. MPI-CAGE-AT-0009]|nr:hypothetical protein B0I37DRAFT_48518 [Chaetomium sp. MPI-CAGE-AT-0009]
MHYRVDIWNNSGVRDRFASQLYIMSQSHLLTTRPASEKPMNQIYPRQTSRNGWLYFDGPQPSALSLRVADRRGVSAQRHTGPSDPVLHVRVSIRGHRPLPDSQGGHSCVSPVNPEYLPCSLASPASDSNCNPADVDAVTDIDEECRLKHPHRDASKTHTCTDRTNSNCYITRHYDNFSRQAGSEPARHCRLKPPTIRYLHLQAKTTPSCALLPEPTVLITQ